MSESSKWMALDRGWPRIIIHKVYCNVDITDSSDCYYRFSIQVGFACVPWKRNLKSTLYTWSAIKAKLKQGLGYRVW